MLQAIPRILCKIWFFFPCRIDARRCSPRCSLFVFGGTWIYGWEMRRICRFRSTPPLIELTRSEPKNQSRKSLKCFYSESHKICWHSIAQVALNQFKSIFLCYSFEFGSFFALLFVVKLEMVGSIHKWFNVATEGLSRSVFIKTFWTLSCCSKSLVDLKVLSFWYVSHCMQDAPVAANLIQ